ncbi:MAG: CDP-diacylglycerol--glycerol-3-phosphate 3-phosphatidyltransferase [Limisphaerales bacterium]
MNLPNKLTVSRLVLTVVFLFVIFIDFPGHETIAFVIFAVASITDYFDGRIARERKLITNFGILMDPLADKILTCSAFIALVELKGLDYFVTLFGKTIEVQVYAWMVCVIVGRELAITGLRMMAASKDVVLAAEGFGKHKTISQMVSLTSLLVLISLKDWGAFGEMFAAWLPWFAFITLWISVVLTLYSGTIYLWNNRNIYLDDM